MYRPKPKKFGNKKDKQEKQNAFAELLLEQQARKLSKLILIILNTNIYIR